MTKQLWLYSASLLVDFAVYMAALGYAIVSAYQGHWDTAGIFLAVAYLADLKGDATSEKVLRLGDRS